MVGLGVFTVDGRFESYASSSMVKLRSSDSAQTLNPLTYIREPVRSTSVWLSNCLQPGTRRELIFWSIVVTHQLPLESPLCSNQWCNSCTRWLKKTRWAASFETGPYDAIKRGRKFRIAQAACFLGTISVFWPSKLVHVSRIGSELFEAVLITSDEPWIGSIQWPVVLGYAVTPKLLADVQPESSIIAYWRKRFTRPFHSDTRYPLSCWLLEWKMLYAPYVA